MPGNLNLNMSDYQKIIFANNIDENNLDSNHKIDKLSHDYPFVVFFTKYKDNAITNETNTIYNIWKEGVRLTRFVGIDPNANKIQIGDHAVKLHFDYNSGLLSVVDCNQLENIELYAIRYTNRNNSIIIKDDVNLQSVLIDAIDNKFTLVFKFTLSNDYDTDVSQISKQLYVSSDNFTMGPAYQYTIGVSNSNKIGYYAYDCLINIDTEISSNENDRQYIFTSQYDSTVSKRINNLGLRLNPIDYDILCENQKIAGNRISLSSNSQYHFSIIIYPNGSNIYSYPVNSSKRSLTLSVESNNSVCNVLTAPQPINSSKVNFDIKTLNPSGNPSNLSKITLTLNNNDNIISNNIIKSFFIDLTGGNVFFYCGYTEPSNDESFKSKMRNIASDINNKGRLLYDWEDNDWNVIDNDAQYFYIAFTEGYENVIIPCWDGYTIISGTKIYMKMEDGTRFINQNNHPTGITVYKSSVKGKFFGKIQIQ